MGFLFEASSILFLHLLVIVSLPRFLKASSSLGINVFSLFRNNIFEVFITCYFNLNFAHCILYRNFKFKSLLLAPFRTIEISTFQYFLMNYHALCSCSAIQSFFAFKRGLPFNVIRIAGDICISG